jgi:predicted kinase
VKKSLLILRGLPGSGKSSLAEILDIKAVCCADDYFVRDGKYLWNIDKLYAAHMWCERKCRRFMKKQINLIVVTNTFTSARELRPYEDLARQFGYKFFSVVVENRHGGKNSHGVSEETLEKFKNRLMNNIEL